MSSLLQNMVVFNLAILRLLIMIVTVFKYLRHCRKKVYAHKFDSKILLKYISHFPEVFV